MTVRELANKINEKYGMEVCQVGVGNKTYTYYAKQLSRNYLEYLGIEYVSEDGETIIKRGKKLNLNNKPDGYKAIILYDPAIRRATPANERANYTGQLCIGVHRIVYAWFNNFIPDGMVVDHINNIKTDNRLDNLQLLTPRDNVTKEKPESTTEIKCKLNKPRSFYEDKLNKYLAEYEKAKKERNSELAHKLRTNISQTRARLRYYDNHINRR